MVGFLSDYKRNFLFVGDLENMAKHKEHKNFKNFKFYHSLLITLKTLCTCFFYYVNMNRLLLKYQPANSVNSYISFKNACCFPLMVSYMM